MQEVNCWVLYYCDTGLVIRDDHLGYLKGMPMNEFRLSFVLRT